MCVSVPVFHDKLKMTLKLDRPRGSFRYWSHQYVLINNLKSADSKKKKKLQKLGKKIQKSGKILGKEGEMEK